LQHASLVSFGRNVCTQKIYIMMMRLLTCSVLATPLVAKRVAVNVKKHVDDLTGVTLEDLEDSWLSITVTRSGSFFAQGDEVLVVQDGKVSAEGEEEPFGNLVMKEGTVHLETGKGIEDIWAVTGSATDEAGCTKWNKYLELVEELKNRKPPASMYSLAQTNSSKEEEGIICVDWAHVGSTMNPTVAGMYGLLETEATGGRTMHWLRKPGLTVEDAILELTGELINLSPPRASFEDKLKWAAEVVKVFLAIPMNQVVPSLLTMIEDSEYDLGMSKVLKEVKSGRVLELTQALKEALSI